MAAAARLDSSELIYVRMHIPHMSVVPCVHAEVMGWMGNSSLRRSIAQMLHCTSSTTGTEEAVFLNFCGPSSSLEEEEEAEAADIFSYSLLAGPN